MHFKVHFCFRTQVRPRNPHTPIPKLALADTVKTPVARIWSRWANKRSFSRSERKFGTTIETFSAIFSEIQCTCLDETLGEMFRRKFIYFLDSGPKSYVFWAKHFRRSFQSCSLGVQVKFWEVFYLKKFPKFLWFWMKNFWWTLSRAGS